MQPLKTRINKNAPDFKANYEGMQALLKDLDDKLREKSFSRKRKTHRKSP